jgi:clan AA aspartic protease (TIGR02281 family)
MSRLLTVRWPLFARLEALLFFPIALIVASALDPVQTIVDRWVAPALSPVGNLLRIPGQTIFWASVAIVATVPYLLLLIVTDRFLTVRKGFALLSVVLVATWAWAAMHYSEHLAGFVPERLAAAARWAPFDMEAGLVAGFLAFMLHLKALWVGIRDQGDVAMRLIAGREEHAYRPGPEELARRAQDVYYRQTADYRGWRPQEQLAGLAGDLKESPGIKILTALTWIAVIAVTAFAYHNWDKFAALSHGAGNTALRTEVHAEMPTAQHEMPIVTEDRASAMPLAPLSSRGPTANVRPVMTAALPTVQHPTDVSANGQSTSMFVGPNEAVAERDNDGSFVFDAVVNGGHTRMVFDTGASVVVLRPEDAERLGINVNRLTYSAKVKTANGTSEVAPIIIESLMIGNITQRNVVGCVARPGVLHENLLGQAFLARLAGFNVEKNLLVLKGH